MEEFSCCLLGTASGIPTKKRNNVSIALNVNGTFYILDAGEQCAASMLRNEIDYKKIRSVFISHLDVDHFAGVPMLIKSMILWAARKEPLKLFVPEHAIADVKRCLQMMYLLDEVLGFRLEILPLNKNFIYKDENITLSCYSNRHIKNRFQHNPDIIAQHPNLQQESFSFCISTKGEKIIYSGDLALLNELDPFIEDTDLLLSELAHFSPDSFCKYISKKRVKKIIFLHLHPDLDNKEKEILALANKYGLKNTEIGFDGMKI
ncbi:MAG: MBL fold metallo-hydrolase [bacterium]|nr:MBL fold metallo-hydrolase [bacterium]